MARRYVVYRRKFALARHRKRRIRAPAVRHVDHVFERQLEMQTRAGVSSKQVAEVSTESMIRATKSKDVAQRLRKLLLLLPSLVAVAHVHEQGASVASRRDLNAVPEAGFGGAGAAGATV